MKKRILSFVLAIVTIFSCSSFNVKASASLSEESAKKFLRFLSGNAFYTPKSDSAFYNLLIGKENSDDVKYAFLLLVYKTIDENWYEKRLTAIQNSLENYVSDKLGTNAWELAVDVFVDDSGLPTVDLGDIRAVFECVAGLFNMRNSNRAQYFNCMIGIDPDYEFFDIISEANALSCGISKGDKKLIDEWVSYIRNLDDITTSTTGNMQTQNPDLGGDNNSSYRITFDSNCSDISDYAYTYSSAQDNWHVPTMTRKGYIFCGWYYDSACTQSAIGTVILDSDKTFYAKWVRQTYNITFNSNCAEVNSVSYVYDILDDNWYVPDMTRQYYLFEGWYWDVECTKEVDEVVIDRDLTFYAKWKHQFKYSISGNKASITGLNGYQTVNGTKVTDIVIPKQIDYCNVVAIGDRAFADNQDITSVVIPEGVTSVGKSAFSSCQKLTTVSIPQSVTSIGNNAFWFCEKLKTAKIPDGVTIINDNVFEGCSELEDVIIPEGVTSIGDSAFAYCNKMSGNINIPNCTYIGTSAFGWTGIESIAWPEAVTTIKSGMFYGCSALKSMAIPDSVRTIEGSAFAYSGIENVKLPKGITIIDSCLFMGCKSLKSITIPNGVTTIEVWAFQDCTGLEKITLAGNIESVGQGAFENCTGIKEFNISDKVSGVGFDMLNGCYNLESISVDANNPYYSSVDGVLYNKNMTSLYIYPVGKKDSKYVIPNSVKFIGRSAFSSCKYLSTLYIPGGVDIFEGAFPSGPKRVLFGGTEKEWKGLAHEALLNYGLESVPVNYNCKYVLDNGFITDDGNATTVYIEPDEAFFGKTAICAFYDDNGLSDMQLCVIDETQEKLVSVEKHDKIKIMLWEDLVSLKPARDEQEVLSGEW